MVLNDSIRRRLVSLLQPWLQQEPDLDLKLGFLRSHGLARNLRFDISALNDLINESSCLSFKDVKIESLSIQISNWSVPAFMVEVHGVDVTLTVREPPGKRHSRHKPNFMDSSVKEILSVIDPEGSALHDILGRIAGTGSARNQLTTSLLTVILEQSRLQMHDIHLQVQLPITDDVLACLLKMKELKIEAQCAEHACFLGGLIGAIFVPKKEICLLLNILGLELGLKREDTINCSISSKDIFACIKMKDLRHLDFNVCVPEVNSSFSPVDILIMLAFYTVSSRETFKYARGGRELWKIAASRIGPLASCPRLSLHKLVALVVLWLHYVHAYKHLLFLAGYSTEKLFTGSISRMSWDKKFSRSIKHQWKVISDTEKGLPVEAIARARRVARHRSVSNVQHTKDINFLSGINFLRNFFWKICSLLAFLWKIIFYIFYPLQYFIFLKKFSVSDEHAENDGISQDVSEDCSQHGFSLSLGKISVTVSPINAFPDVSVKSDLHTGFLYLDVLSFHLELNGLFVIYTANECEQYLSFSCGDVKVASSSPSEISYMKRNLRKDTSDFFKGHAAGRVNDSNVIIWSEPKCFLLPENSVNSSATCTGNGHLSFLETFLEEMWSNWKRTRKKFQGSETKYLESAFIICEIKSFLIDPCLSRPDCGLLKCSLDMGKLNFDLGYTSIMSIALLLRQIQRALYWTANKRGPSHSPSTIEDPPKSKWEHWLDFYTTRMKTTMLNMIPEKNIQVGVLIAGPTIQISLGKESLHGGKEDLHLLFDVHDVELAVWKTPKADSLASSQDPRSGDTRQEYLWLKEPRLLNIPEPNSCGTYISKGRISLDSCLRINGLDAYLENSDGSIRSQLIVIKPISIQLSSLREYFISLTVTSIALSTAFCGEATGISVISYLDELAVLSQVLEDILSAVSYALTYLDSGNCGHFGQTIMQEVSSTMPNTCGAMFSSKAEALSLVLKSTLFVIDATIDIKSADLFLDNSRSNKMEKYLKIYDSLNRKKLAIQDLPENGVWIGIQQLCIQASLEEGQLEVLCDISGIRSVIFKYQSENRKCIDESELRNMLLQYQNCLYETSLSNCTFNLWIGSHKSSSYLGRVSNLIDGSTSIGEPSSVVSSLPSTILAEGSNVQSFGSNRKLIFRQLTTSNDLSSATGCQLFINIALSEIFMVECSLRHVLVAAHEPKKLLSLLSSGGEFQIVSWEIQGGAAFLGTKALAIFVHYFDLYAHCTASLLSNLTAWVDTSFGKQTESYEPVESTVRPCSFPLNACAQGSTSSEFPMAEHKSLEALTIRISEFSLVLVVSDEYGGLQEFMIDTDMHLNIKWTNRRSFLLDLSRLTLCSQKLQKLCEEQKANKFRIPHFSSVTLDDVSSHVVPGDPTLSCLHEDGSHQVCDTASSSTAPIANKERYLENGVSQFFQRYQQNYILKHAAVFITVERSEPGDELGPPWLRQNWVGSGSFSGFDLTITLSEMQMLWSLWTSYSGVFGEETSLNLKQIHMSRNQAVESASEVALPDGAIVVVQDIREHMYFAVEAVENKYYVAGLLHYSLVGERALFRVKHQKKRWRSSVLWFSLISLHAKNDSGEPLRLNGHSRSGFVDISGTNDDGWALWKVLPCKSKNVEGDNELEPHDHYDKITFHLVNKKTDCGVAFVDGIPEFVKKPGNPFKVKVLHDPSLAHGISGLNTYSGENSGTGLQHNSCVDNQRFSGLASIPPHIEFTVDKVSLTIVHEVSQTNDIFPLLRGCVDNIQFIIQILSSKARVISTFTAAFFYHDVQRNLWREIIRPVELCIYYRFAFCTSDIIPQRVPVRLYLRLKEVDISLTELSMDILLFVIGKLNLAGPFAVRSSMIFSNCCKVENQSGLSLLCHFHDNHYVTIARRQSASIILRNLTLADQPLENESFLSIQFGALGALSTSPIRLSLSESRVVACRTRVIAQDSRTFPGPFIVVDISRNIQDGLSVIVSPILRIHNETGLSMKMRFRRPQQSEVESASVLLRSGDSIDDSMAVFDAINFSGGLKKALMSLSLGNFLLSFCPEITECSGNSERSVTADWSYDLKGGKAVCLSGIFDKLSYKFRRAFGFESMKESFSTMHCSLKSGDVYISDIHFLIHSIGRDVPVVQPGSIGDAPGTKNSPVALQEQKEIFLLPTVKVLNLLSSTIHVLLTETHPDLCTSSNNIGKEETIPCGSTSDFYVNPAIIYFMVTLTETASRCKPVNSGDWVKKLHKPKNDVHYLDIDLDFGGGKYFALLRLSRGDRGILEAVVFTSYVLQNDTDLGLLCFAARQKPLSREEFHNFDTIFPPELGSILPPKSTRSWFLKSNKVRLKLWKEEVSEVLLDFDALSVSTEVRFEVEERMGIKQIAIVGLSLSPSLTKVLPSQIISLVPRYVISNESEDVIFVRQCYLEDDRDALIAINGKQKLALQFQTGINKRRVSSLFDSLFRKHRNADEDSLLFIQFQLNESGCSWSGPICISSLGRFFIKFRRFFDSQVDLSDQIIVEENKLTEYAVVHVVEEGSTIVLLFDRLRNISLPYRIENCLQEASITYYQKDFSGQDVLESGKSVDYVWDDLNLPHKLVVQINNTHLLREINMDKVRAWKPFFKVRQHRVLALPLLLATKPGDNGRAEFDESNGVEVVKVGYEVYADGLTRVLRICEFPDSCKEERVFQPCAKIQLRISCFAVQFLESRKQDADDSDSSIYTQIIVARLGNIYLDSVFTEKYKYNQLIVQSVNVDEKWVGAPFAAMLRRNQVDNYDANENVLHVAFVLLSSSSSVKHVKCSSIILQPIDLNLDEETLMRLVPFWRTSLSDSNTQSQQFYFEHFEIHPIKIIASFLPGDSYSSYSSAQETLRSLLHSVIKIPAVKNMAVELNGVLVTHALITIRELCVKCLQHYSWYAMRAIYIAKGSPFLPPAFASIFDDSASSSLDVFFDPSNGLINLPGLTLGTFKFISKCINRKGFSGTKRYFGDLGKTMKTAGSNVLFAAITEISDSVLKGAETRGFNGMVNGFHQGILKLAMEPSLLGTAVMEGGPDRKIKLDRSPGIDELYIEGYLQAMLDTMYKQEYLRVKVVDDQILLKNLPPNSSLIEEIMDRVKSFLVSKALLKGEPSATSRSLRHLRGESEWRIGPTVITLCEHLFVSFAIRMLRKQAAKAMANIKWKKNIGTDEDKAVIPKCTEEQQEGKFKRTWGIRKFFLSGVVAYIDGRLCRCIPNPLVRRIVSGFFLSFLDENSRE